MLTHWHIVLQLLIFTEVHFTVELGKVNKETKWKGKDQKLKYELFPKGVPFWFLWGPQSTSTSHPELWSVSLCELWEILQINMANLSPRDSEGFFFCLSRKFKGSGCPQGISTSTSSSWHVNPIISHDISNVVKMNFSQISFGIAKLWMLRNIFLVSCGYEIGRVNSEGWKINIEWHNMSKEIPEGTFMAFHQFSVESRNFKRKPFLMRKHQLHGDQRGQGSLTISFFFSPGSRRQRRGSILPQRHPTIDPEPIKSSSFHHILSPELFYDGDCIFWCPSERPRRTNWLDKLQFRLTPEPQWIFTLKFSFYIEEKNVSIRTSLIIRRNYSFSMISRKSNSGKKRFRAADMLTI